MYIRFSALLPVAALAAVVAAAPSALDVRASSSSCNTGSIQCCTQTSSSTDTSSSSLTSVLGLLGIVIPDVTGLIAIGCTGATVCAQQPVCCTGNTFNGLVNIGCNPIIINV